MINKMFCEWPACLALDSTTVTYYKPGRVKRLFTALLKRNDTGRIHTVNGEVNQDA